MDPTGIGDRGLKICSTGPGLLTKMTVMPIDGQKHKKSCSSELSM